MAIHRSDSIDIFLSLLRSGLYGEPMPESGLPGEIDWKAVVTLAKKHCVYGLIIEGVRFLPERLRPSATLSAKMRKFALGLIRTNLILDRTVGRLATFLKRHGIDGVLLKGQGVARLYRAPQMRQSGDIDFYVGRKAYAGASCLCRENLADDKDACKVSQQHFGFDFDGVTVELHPVASRVYTPFRRKWFQDWIVEQLEHSPDRRTVTLGNVDITLPPLDFDAIYIFYHAWRHYVMGGIGLRQLCDWTLIFHNHAADIDTERLKLNIHRFGMTKGWKLFACIAVDHLGLEPDRMPLYDPAYRERAEIIFADIMAGGNFGFYTKGRIRPVPRRIDIRHGFGTFRIITGYFLKLFPILPVEATFLYFSWLHIGLSNFTKRALRKSRK